MKRSEVRSQKSEARKKSCLLSLASCIFFYCLLLTAFTGCAATQEASANADPALLYTEGVILYQDGDYNEAIDKFKKVMEDYPLSPSATDAQLLLADTYYVSAQYSDAA